MDHKLTAFEQTLLKIDSVCHEHQIGYIVIGGVAVMQHLEFRTTKVIDISLALDISNIRSTCDIFLSHFESVYKNPHEFFEKYFVLPLLDSETGLRVDLSAGLGGFEQNAVRRGHRIQFSNIEINVCSVEDLIIFKLVAARPVDLADVEMLIQRYLPEIDQNYLTNRAQEFRFLERSDVPERLVNFIKNSKFTK